MFLQKYFILFLLFILPHTILEGQILGKDSLTIDETWHLLQNIEKLTIEEGMEIIKHIQFESEDHNEYKEITDSIWSLINKPFKKIVEEQNKIRDSLNKITWDTLSFEFYLNGVKMFDNSNIHMFFLTQRTNYYEREEIQIIDSNFIIPETISYTDSGIFLIQYKEMFFYEFQKSWKYIASQYKIGLIVDIYPFNENENEGFIGEMAYKRAREENMEAIFKISYHKAWTEKIIYISDLKDCFKKGRKYVYGKKPKVKI